jgi:hypothetical protein
MKRVPKQEPRPLASVIVVTTLIYIYIYQSYMDLQWSFVSSIMASSSASASHYHSLPLQAKNPHMETISIIPLWSVCSIFSTVEYIWIFHEYQQFIESMTLIWSCVGQENVANVAPVATRRPLRELQLQAENGLSGEEREGRKSPQWYDADARVKNSVWHIWFGLLREPCYMCSWEFLKACVKKGYVYHL